MEAYNADTLMGASANNHMRVLLLFGDENQRTDAARHPDYTLAPWVSQGAPTSTTLMMTSVTTNRRPAQCLAQPRT